MRVQKSLILFLPAIIMLPQMQASGSHSIGKASSEEKEPGLRTKYSSMFLRSYSVESKKNKISSIHTVSHRLVPCGPNPLPDWLDFTVCYIYIYIILLLLFDGKKDIYYTKFFAFVEWIMSKFFHEKTEVAQRVLKRRLMSKTSKEKVDAASLLSTYKVL